MGIIKAFERIEEMDREYIAAIKDKLSTQLPKKRYEHSVGVSYISSALAMRYGADIYKAELAGILHDCAKAYSNKELIIFYKEYEVRNWQKRHILWKMKRCFLQSDGILQVRLI